ncbi:hypothetical protein ASC95_14475 [Pelomonas sp. Root1217]|uniref:hypothetical protein n=1 Tax=Pelomonas sp. Root1217 TaxID=1736430 RepID=UPI00070FE9F3|nr:hypothetical protein [Pelomonas sp. Root1217]KQV50565.1 hypothetical protein ASC95_14475 [Pelomonas sp. Root1217]
MTQRFRPFQNLRTLLVLASLTMAPVMGSAAEKDDLTQLKEIEALRKEIAEARKAAAEAEAAEAKARLGSLTATAPTGAATGLSAEGKLLAYAAVDDVARIIAAEVKRTVNDLPVVIYSAKELNAVVQARAVLRSVQDLHKAMGSFRVSKLAAEVDDCKEPGEGGATVPVLDALSIVQSLFKVSKNVEGADVTVDDFALASAVLRQLRLAGVNNVVYPSQYFAGAFSDPNKDPLANSEIAKGLAALNTDLAQVDLRLTEIAKRREKVQQRADDKTKPATPACQAAFAEAKILFDNGEARGTALKTRANAIIASAAAIDEATGAIRLQVLAQMEELSKGRAGAHVLQLKPVGAGGTTLTKTNLFWTNFFVSGSAVVAYMLTDTAGAVVSSGVVGEHGGQVKLGDLRQEMQAHRALVNARP